MGRAEQAIVDYFVDVNTQELVWLFRHGSWAYDPTKDNMTLVLPPLGNHYTEDYDEKRGRNLPNGLELNPGEALPSVTRLVIDQVIKLAHGDLGSETWELNNDIECRTIRRTVKTPHGYFFEEEVCSLEGEAFGIGSAGTWTKPCYQVFVWPDYLYE